MKKNTSSSRSPSPSRLKFHGFPLTLSYHARKACFIIFQKCCINIQKFMKCSGHENVRIPPTELSVFVKKPPWCRCFIWLAPWNCQELSWPSEGSSVLTNVAGKESALVAFSRFVFQFQRELFLGVLSCSPPKINKNLLICDKMSNVWATSIPIRNMDKIARVLLLAYLFGGSPHLTSLWFTEICPVRHITSSTTKLDVNVLTLHPAHQRDGFTMWACQNYWTPKMKPIHTTYRWVLWINYMNYIYLEPVCPLFWGFNPPKQGLCQSKHFAPFGFQVYIPGTQMNDPAVLIGVERAFFWRVDLHSEPPGWGSPLFNG